MSYTKRLGSAYRTLNGTKSDTVDLARSSTGFIAKSTGNAVVMSPGDTDFQTFPVISGAQYAVQVRRVSTTSVDLQLLFDE